jgi:two-component system sensor histidine kinase ChvG
MALDTGTAITDRARPHSPAIGRPGGDSAAGGALPRQRFAWALRPAWLSPLTRRILAVNMIAIGLLGLLYLGEYRQSLVTAQLQDLKTQGQIFAAALAEGAVLDTPGEDATLIPDLGSHMMMRLVEPTTTRAQLFDDKGTLIADSRLMRGTIGDVEITELPPAGSTTR